MTCFFIRTGMTKMNINGILFLYICIFGVYKEIVLNLRMLYAMLKKPTAQTAHLVFADTKANA